MTLRDRVREIVRDLAMSTYRETLVEDTTDSILQAVREEVESKKSNHCDTPQQVDALGEQWERCGRCFHCMKDQIINLINAEIDKGVDDESR